MRILTIVTWVLGLALIAFLVYMADARAVVHTAAMVGWGFAPVLLVRVVLLYVDSHSWRWLLRPTDRLGLHLATFQRWIGESVSVLLPFAVIGGELVRVRLAMLYGIAGAPALASIVMDAVVAAMSQMLFFGLGVAIYARIATRPDALTQSILLGGVALSIVVVAMWMSIRGGAVGRFGRLLKGLVAGERVAWLGDAMGSVDRHIVETADRRGDFWRSVAWRLVGWLLGASEIWLILWLLGRPITVAEALMLDALAGAVRNVFFFVPGGLGVQEGALVLLGGTLGIGSETMLGMALVKRAREVVVSVPGLVAWQVVEAREIRQ
jgi:putative membrane protein